MKGTVRFEFEMPRQEINVSKPARDLIGEENLHDFVESLRGLMKETGHTWALVYRRGKTVTISLGR